MNFRPSAQRGHIHVFCFVVPKAAFDTKKHTRTIQRFQFQLDVNIVIRISIKHNSIIPNESGMHFHMAAVE